MNSAAAAPEAQRRGSAHPKNGQLPVEVPKNGPVSTASMACDYWLLEGYAGPCGIPNVPQPSHFTLYRERQLLFRPFGSAVVVKPALKWLSGPRAAYLWCNGWRGQGLSPDRPGLSMNRYALRRHQSILDVSRALHVQCHGKQEPIDGLKRSNTLHGGPDSPPEPPGLRTYRPRSRPAKKPASH